MPPRITAAKQVVFSSHSGRLLKQSAFSVNLSISAAEALTAGRGRGNRGAQWAVTPVYVHKRCVKELQVRGAVELQLGGGTVGGAAEC